MSKESEVCNPEEIRVKNIIQMGLNFSSMIRLFEKDSKKNLWNKIVSDVAPKIFKAQSREEFDQIYREFCDWGTEHIVLAQKKKRNGSIKKKKPASYGQIAKTFNVTLKVAIYYCHLPDYQKSENILKWLHAGVDTRMMAMLKKKLEKKHPEYFQDWPKTVEAVDNEKKYLDLQKVVGIFIEEKQDKNLRLPVQFDDVYWYKIKQKLERDC